MINGHIEESPDKNVVVYDGLDVPIEPVKKPDEYSFDELVKLAEIEDPEHTLTTGILKQMKKYDIKVKNL